MFCFFSEREDCRAEGELYCGQRRAGGRASRRRLENAVLSRCQLSGKGHALECHPYTQHAEPRKAPSGPRRRPIGITRWTENQRGRLECSLLTTLGPLRLEQLKGTGERSESGKKGASFFFFFFELHLFFAVFLNFLFEFKF